MSKYVKNRVVFARTGKIWYKKLKFDKKQIIQNKNNVKHLLNLVEIFLNDTDLWDSKIKRKM